LYVGMTTTVLGTAGDLNSARRDLPARHPVALTSSSGG